MKEKPNILIRNPLLIFFILLLVCVACQKVSEDKRPEFIGFWHANTGDDGCASITINADGSGEYCIRFHYDREKIYSGTVRVNDKHIYIAGKDRFDIIEYPHKIDTNVEHETIHFHNNDPDKTANWKMVLYGLKPNALHICGKWEYYKADY